jgi:triacylglycerol esterase/lipase EstA (alpha/beta hydrolase family)
MHDISNYGSHAAHWPGTSAAHVNGKHTRNAHIRHLGYHLAWYIWDQYTSKGYTVQIVAHSMGGLMARYAISKVESGAADFPPYLYVEDVVTAGTPHQRLIATSNAPTCIRGRISSTI